MNNPVDNDLWLWADAEANPGDSFQMLFEGSPWREFSGVGVPEFAFSISKVPEPTEAALLCSGLLMLGIFCVVPNSRKPPS